MSAKCTVPQPSRLLHLDAEDLWHTKDVCHDELELPKACLYVIEHSAFQKMRNIKQLGLLQYVYPNAVGTRFSHSLGVGHLAWQVVKGLQGQLQKPEFANFCTV